MLAAHLLQSTVLVGHIHPRHYTQEQHREYYSRHAERIGYGISQRYGRIVETRNVGISILRCAQTCRISYGSGHYAHHRRHGSIGNNVYYVCRGHTQQYDSHSATDKFYAALPE